MEQVAMVVIVGAGPSGLAVSACLNRLRIPNVMLERDGCYASLWRKRTHDHLKLQFAKQFCELPYMPYPYNAPKFITKNGFLSYIDDYVKHFGINPLYNRLVESAHYDGDVGTWRINVRNTCSSTCEVYFSLFLVVATGENSEGIIPNVPGLDSFRGQYLHSNQYVNGIRFCKQDVLVVGCGNSGMEIAYDLSKHARTAIVARSPVHILTKEMVYLGMVLLKFLSIKSVDKIIMSLSKLRNGDISKYGLQMPKEAPFYLKSTTGQLPTIDFRCLKQIKKGNIKVFPSISSIRENMVEFTNGDVSRFDAIIFATGYKTSVKEWLKDCGLFDEDGMPKQDLTNKWKGENGLYCVGFGKIGLLAISSDAKKVARDIYQTLGHNN